MGAGTYWGHLAFGLFMVSTAAFSHRPWLTEAPFDEFEDVLHSITATGMGFAFAFGVVIRLLQRERGDNPRKIFDAVAIVAATALPLMGDLWPAYGGLTQRVLFLVAYLWYGAEAHVVGTLAESARHNVLPPPDGAVTQPPV